MKKPVIFDNRCFYKIIKFDCHVVEMQLSKLAYPKQSKHWLNKELSCCEMSGKYFLKFRVIDKSFDCMRFYDGKRWDYQCFVPNQLLLFQKLHEWNFDLYNLLDNNLAIELKN